jgi:hypothetical protein
MLEVIAAPAALYTLIASTSGPFGYVPRPPNVVFVNSFNSPRSNSESVPGAAMNENTVSPGNAYGGRPNLNVIVVVPGVIGVELDVWLVVTL